VQLNPSRNRAIRGCVVAWKSACWVVSCPWTWSNVKCCFLALAAGEGDGGAVTVPPPGAAGADVVASMETEVDEEAWMTVR
jgi:hypothetical protein